MHGGSRMATKRLHMSTAVSDRIVKAGPAACAVVTGLAARSPTHVSSGCGLASGSRPFRPGSAVTGVITPTTMDEEIAKEQKPYAGMRFTIVVDRIEPEKAFSFRWNPHGMDEKVDFSNESRRWSSSPCRRQPTACC